MPFFVEGEFLEIDRPWRIIQTWEPQWDAGNRTTLTYQLSPIQGGRGWWFGIDGLKGRPESYRSHGDGWIKVLGWLAADIGPKPEPDTAKYFVARLIGPRADSPRAQRRGDGHDDGARTLLAAADGGRQVIALGPVNDPAWTYGLGILRG